MVRMRTWCEQGFKCTKRGGWQWQQTRMVDPARASRLWLALAVASLWVVTLGSELETGPTNATQIFRSAIALGLSTPSWPAAPDTALSAGPAVAAGAAHRRSPLAFAAPVGP